MKTQIHVSEKITKKQYDEETTLSLGPENYDNTIVHHQYSSKI